MSHSNDHIADTVKEFYGYLKGYVIKKVQDPVLAEDLTQEVMYRLAKADDENRDIRNVKAWLFQTTRHVIADHYRKESRSPMVDLHKPFVMESAEDLSGFQNLPDLGDEFVSISDVDFIIPMLKLLPKEYGKPLIMSDIENIPQKEIAEHLGLGLSAVKMRIKRAREKLHSLFVECCEIEFDSRGDFAGCTIKEYCTPLLEIRRDLCNQSTSP
ncbi:MAG: sigma-70 family RNA polymerase sigma factor [Balneolaceae bacterium]|nr:sigma-70 family RNA polymerase sigma factor [Balneolaceae bacterium]